MNVQPSTSEDNGIAILSDNDINVYSVGISTGGVAEVRMARANLKRRIIATTVDERGLDFARENITKLGLDKRIRSKLEDVSNPLPYKDAYFDFIYARLVLHYLSAQDLGKALEELRRVLKPGGRMFVVVRSVKCADAKARDAVYDESTGFTSRRKVDKKTGKPHTTTRYFHTPESITSHIKSVGFTVGYVKSYEEQLYRDFMRVEISDTVDHLVELLATK